jgi:Secretion system C-terminal sorting domain
MKKIYLLILTVATLSFKAQTCYIDHTEHHQGIWPDSAHNFVSGTVGVAYNQNITIRIPHDTIVGSVTCTYSKMVLGNTDWNLPPGLSLAGTPSNFNFPGNDSSCMVIYGTPTTAGTYNLKFVIKVYCTQLGNAFPATTFTATYYKITINPAGSGIAKQNGYGFEVAQNSPNPLANTTTIKYTAEMEAKMKFTVYNITGQKIVDKDIQAQRGDNSYLFDASTLENGVYIYSLEMNGQKQVRRMVVSK